MKRQSNRGCSKGCAQQGRRHFDARSVLIHEHDKGPICLRACALERLQRVNVPLRRRQGTPLTPFFNISIISTPQTLSPLNQEDILGPHLHAMVIEPRNGSWVQNSRSRVNTSYPIWMNSNWHTPSLLPIPRGWNQWSKT